MFNQNDLMTLSKISANIPGALLVYKANETEDIIFVSDEIAKIFECDSPQDFMRFTGGNFNTIVYPEDIEEVDSIIKKQIKETNGFDYVTYRIITKNGNIKKIEDWGHLVHDEELGDLFYVYLHDMEVRENLTAISGQTNLPEPKANVTDELTGLANIKSFRQKAPEFIKDFIKRGGHPHCIYLNIRNFHTYNETYGFSGGDRMLKSVARILLETFPNGLVSRFNDDHFVVMTAQENLIEKINRMSVRINNIRQGAIVEIKAGIFTVTNPRTDISVVCDCAKFACDTIKHEYGTNVQFYDGEMNEKLKLQEHIIKTFQTALDEEYIKVFFQPVVEVESGNVVSVEALTRWEDPEYGRLSPAEFINTLEEQHIIHKLDIFVINKVCEHLRLQRERGEKLIPVSLNLSRLDFELVDIVKVIEDSVSRNSLTPYLVRFELTESLIAVDLDEMKRETERLRKHGFKVWMDAFGAGYSSLKVLKDFSLDGLKIDMDVIKSFGDERTNTIISSVIEMARRLNIPALSKGVETKEQLEFLKNAGCSLAQGYLLGRPAPIKE
ncbi:MAG: EAL domain-containing protein [Synergistaceae bacterium]|nr:EAL domain-containing protein [Synergistaceae bacterium]MBR0074430.1 EAL domain-containing protein [Synergistaceae bacterium]MBR0232890.1 EAL domain-containing protein [Synergistaceae bacterium]